MRISIVTVGSKMPRWVIDACAEYYDRIPQLGVNTVEISLNKRSKNADIERLIEKESQQMLAALSPQQFVIALDVQGKFFSTEEFSELLGQHRNQSRDVAFLIGGPEGLSKDCLARADLRLSLSPLTFAHPLVRAVLAEQIYRAWTLLIGHPYHRA